MSRRLSENKFNSFKYSSKWELKGKHERGPLFVDTESSVNQYEQIIFDKYHFIIRHKSNSDCYALLKDGTIVEINNIINENLQQIHHTKLICKQFMKYENYFDYPCESKKLQIFRINKLQESFKIINLSQIKAKCIIFQDKISHIAYPLLHTITM